MLDIKFIRENPDLVKRGAADKRIKIDLEALLTLDSEVRPLQTELEGLQADRNRISKNIATAKPDEREPLKAEVQKIKARMDELSKVVDDKKAKLDELLLLVPQPARADVPVGKDDSENVEVKLWGTVPKFDFKPLDHITLGEKHKIIDFERGAKLAVLRSARRRCHLRTSSHALHLRHAL